MVRAAFVMLGSERFSAALRTESRFGMANGNAVRQGRSDIDAFGDAQSVFEFNAEVTHGAVDLGVTEQQLHGPQIANLSISFRCDV